MLPTLSSLNMIKGPRKVVSKWQLQNLFLGIGFRVLGDPGTLPLQPREKEAWLLFQLAADFGIIHVVQQLWGQEGFHSDFRRGPGRPGRVTLRDQRVKL